MTGGNAIHLYARPSAGFATPFVAPLAVWARWAMNSSSRLYR